MVRCPKCHEEDDYAINVIFDTDSDDDTVVELGKAKCYNCGHEFLVRSFYKWEKDELVER